MEMSVEGMVWKPLLMGERSRDLGSVERELDRLRKEQENTSHNAHSAKGRLETLKNDVEKSITRLQESMSKYVPSLPKDAALNQAEDHLHAWQLSLEKNGPELEKNAPR